MAASLLKASDSAPGATRLCKGVNGGGGLGGGWRHRGHPSTSRTGAGGQMLQLLQTPWGILRWRKKRKILRWVLNNFAGGPTRLKCSLSSLTELYWLFLLPCFNRATLSPVLHNVTSHMNYHTKVVLLSKALCVCVCVCVWDRERERERDRQTDRQTDRQCWTGSSLLVILDEITTPQKRNWPSEHKHMPMTLNYLLFPTSSHRSSTQLL